MKEYWCVTSKFYDSGKVRVTMGSTLAKSQPDDTSEFLDHVDIYNDWFNNEEEARSFSASGKYA